MIRNFSETILGVVFWLAKTRPTDTNSTLEVMGPVRLGAIDLVSKDDLWKVSLASAVGTKLCLEIFSLVVGVPELASRQLKMIKRYFPAVG